ncbi:PIG-L family deacetylase [Candidatus Albibeggiatoa sp. nov. NOAA]|uniref:PIG-L deacetylase family protein n=1 Tax=Candidatus Albibeggiatoa sp. nov. NOAA TaxID=3162724 RepID=UPI0032F77FE7|nr:PIG-L family deacetylase [Thiotrichaceae bacterium]
MEHTLIPYTATTTLPEGEVLVLAPHPDDEVFGCGGAIMQHVAQGQAVHVVIMTDGQAAMPYQHETYRDAYISQRQQESLQAAKILGYGKPTFFDISDRHLHSSDALLTQLSDFIVEHNIQHVYAPSIFEIHPDHIALAKIAIELIQSRAEVQLIMYEVGVPLMPNRLLDLTALWARKKAAMACFNSQLALQNYDKHIEGLNTYRAYTLPQSVKAAEAYYVANPHQNWQQLIETCTQFRTHGE